MKSGNLHITAGAPYRTILVAKKKRQTQDTEQNNGFEQDRYKCAAPAVQSTALIFERKLAPTYAARKRTPHSVDGVEKSKNPDRARESKLKTQRTPSEWQRQATQRISLF